MPTYQPSLADDALSDLLQEAPIRVNSLDDLAHLAARLGPLEEWVHTMEVHEMRGDKAVGRLDYAIMGLDGEDEWEVPMEPARMRALLETKIEAMRASGHAFTFDLWMGETAE